MKIAFSTLGCPQWDLETVCVRARAYGYDGVDFRGLRGELDVTVLPEFTSGLQTTARRIQAAGLEVAAVSSSIRLCEAGRRAALAEAERTIPVAIGLGCRAIRVFGGGDRGRDAPADLVETGAECMRAILALEGARALAWLVESHDAFVRGRDLRLLIDRVNDPAFGALWDIGNSFMLGGELPQATLAALGPYVGGVHLKDAVREAARTPGAQDSWRYVPPGTGEIPLAEGLRLLQAQAYGGWLVFEHEKRWHPQLPEPEEALPQFADWIRALR